MLDDAVRLIDQFLHRNIAMLSVVALIIGLCAGDSVSGAAWAIPWLFSSLTFNSGLRMCLRDLRSLRDRPWILPLHLLLLHFAAPLAVWALACPFFAPDPVMGFIFIAMMPMSVSSILWTGMFRGNAALVTALIVVDTLFAPFIIPYALRLFSGASVQLDSFGMLRGLFWMLFFPTLLGLLLNRLSGGGAQRLMGDHLSMLTKVAWILIFLINGGVTAPFFLDFSLSSLLLFVMAGFVSALLFVMNYGLGRLLFLRQEDVLAFTLGASMRSLTAGVVIAVTYFSPLTTFTVLLGMVIQQPLGALAGKIITRLPPPNGRL